jgi:penicillin-binding protein 1A
LSACRLSSDKSEFQEAAASEEYLAQDLEIQSLLEQHFVTPLRSMVEKRHLPSDTDSAAVVLENSTGNVLAYVGTVQDQSDYDNARRLVRSCGSIAKPLFYGAALESRVVSPDENVVDEPTCFRCPSCKGGVYCPDNYGGVYANGPLPLRDALALSRNIPAIKVYQRLSRKQFDDAIEKLGLPKPSNYMTAPLGWEISPLRVAAAYTVFANGGYAIEPRFITHTVANGQKHEVPVRRRPQVFSQAVCDWCISALRLCLTSGTGRAASTLADCLAGKTGSSDSAWACLFGSQVGAVCWVGRRDSNTDTKTTGGRLAMPLLAGFFADLRKARPQLTPRWRNS